MGPAEHRLSGHRLALVWPGVDEVRRVARALLSAGLRPRRELVGAQGPRNGSGRADGEFWEWEGWFLKSREARTFADLGAAEAALERLAAIKERLGELAPAHTGLFVYGTPAGRFQLWTLAPRLQTLREQLDLARSAREPGRIRRVLLAYARCLGLTLEAAVVLGLSIDPNPSNFAAQGGRIRYIDDDAAWRGDAIGIEDAFLARFTEYPDFPAPVLRAYLLRFVAEVAMFGDAGVLRRLRLPDRLRAAGRLRRGAEPWATETAELLVRAACVG